ncbi:MAG: hypothetical protein K2X87_25875 [Gemmataceae bacterium]|nr:hypothetical protein [Gemmataceae bacterium]
MAPAPAGRPPYAVKANIDPLVLRELFAGGAAADVASAFEVDICRALGLGGDRMVLSHPRKDPDTVRAMAAARPWGTAVDSDEEVDKLAAAGMSSSRTPGQPSAALRPGHPVRLDRREDDHLVAPDDRGGAAPAG